MKNVIEILERELVIVNKDIATNNKLLKEHEGQIKICLEGILRYECKKEEIEEAIKKLRGDNEKT